MRKLMLLPLLALTLSGCGSHLSRPQIDKIESENDLSNVFYSFVQVSTGNGYSKNSFHELELANPTIDIFLVNTPTTISKNAVSLQITDAHELWLRTKDQAGELLSLHAFTDKGKTLLKASWSSKTVDTDSFLIF